ncbi:MAG: 16S rRNA (guanine(527)-N(7))-methyltransferase RsmG [Saprospiraceae bacterium]|nr:16S rRNA (guanine(527)-N(7))-methyltransferase RsmG [Saprospiraceae bacterium]MBL0025339.1 16S rRNA (guanine(527)-N(7))-methyltransferase RsmG [Saprospiraceae bacterium]
MDTINKFFPELTDSQMLQFGQLESIYHDWNQKINVISRKDIDNLYLNHVLHSLAIAVFISFKKGTKIIDLGTGGGFPGIPLAIMFPQCDFLLIDSINKKLHVVNEVVTALDLKNVKTKHSRVENLNEKCDFVVTRAVAKIDILLPWARLVLSKSHKNTYPNGLIALKGNLKSELELIPKYEYREIVPIIEYFNETYFEEKYLLYIQG